MRKIILIAAVCCVGVNVAAQVAGRYYMTGTHNWAATATVDSAVMIRPFRIEVAATGVAEAEKKSAERHKQFRDEVADLRKDMDNFQFTLKIYFILLGIWALINIIRLFRS